MAFCVSAWWRIFSLFFLLLLLAACSKAADGLPSLTGYTMGSRWSVTLKIPAGSHREALRAGIQARFDAIDQQMSTWKSDSDVSRFNNAPANSWQSFPDKLFLVLQQALALAGATQGAFDPTVGSLVDLWGFGPAKRERQAPDEAAIQQALTTVGWQRIRLDAAQKRAFQPGGVRLDLSAIAKGFAVDDVSEWLLSQGVENFLVDLSGELRAHGSNAQGMAWRVAVERPGAAVASAKASDLTPYVIELRNRAVATSGDYRHSFSDQGRHYSHHIDPRSGRPVPYEVASVTVIAERCVEADPLGTTLTVMGADAGMAWAQQRGLAVLMLVHTEGDKLEQRMTPAFRQLLDASVP